MKLSNAMNLPQYLHQIREDVERLYKIAEEQNQKIIDEQEANKRTNEKLEAESADFRGRESKLTREIDTLRDRNAELEHMVTLLKQKSGTTKPSGKVPAAAADGELFADNHDLDKFYLEFENHFRGSEEEIKKKQLPYIEVLNEGKLDKKLPVADLGCGRGEFLQLLAENKFRPLGVDLNEAMVERAKEQGFEAVKDDAISFLLKQKSGSLSGVTGFHIAEHIPFEQLLLLISEAYRCLAKGGILLLETPNPESLFVGAYTFHFDPSHLKPLPPAIVQFSAQFKGFERADILRMQPELSEEEIAKATKNLTLQGALKRLYGPRDYALVAYK